MKIVTCDSNNYTMDNSDLMEKSIGLKRVNIHKTYQSSKPFSQTAGKARSDVSLIGWSTNELHVTFDTMSQPLPKSSVRL